MKSLMQTVLLCVSVCGLAVTATVHAADREYVLALGDSVAFGYITQDGYAYVNPENFIGYPEHLSNLLHKEVLNSACPGETTAGFLNSAGADNGCDPYKAAFPLHVPYHKAPTQLAFATSVLSKLGQNVRLVTLQLGANDGFLLEKSCNYDPSCIAAGIPALTAQVATNLATVIADLRSTGYSGPLIVVNYYSTDYTDPNATALTSYLNAAIGQAAVASGAQVADIFTAFQKASAAAAGKTCVAGLLNVNPANPILPGATCDVHPSQSGQRLIAHTISSVVPDIRW